MTAFGDAFKTARKAGKKTFMFGGKSYTTKTKEETAPVPKAKPAKFKTPPVPVAKPDKFKSAGSKASLGEKRTPSTLRPNDKTHDYFINSDGAGMRKKPNQKYKGNLKKQ